MQEHGKNIKKDPKQQISFSDSMDRINSSASDDSQGIKLVTKKHEQTFVEGQWNFNKYNNQAGDFQVDVSSLDIFSLARHGKYDQLKQVL